MGIVSIALVLVSGVYLALGLMYLRLWLNERSRRDYLAFALTCLLSTCFSWFELGMMHSVTPSGYLFFAYWNFFPGNLALVAMAWFAYLRLNGRKWLFVSYAGSRLLAVVIHIAMPNGINFRQINAVGKNVILGEMLSYPISIPNPWMVIPHLSHVLMIVFFLDASVRCWQRGERRVALTFGTGALLFGTTILMFGVSVLWGLAPIPLAASFAVLFIVGAMLYELNYDMHRAAMLSETLQERDARLTETLDQLQLSAAAANVGLWTRKVRDETVWLSERAADVWGFQSGSRVSREDVVHHIHPDDRESYIANLHQVEEWKNEYEIEYRFVVQDEPVRWIHSRGKAEEVDGCRIIRGAIVDITKLKIAQEAIQESEARFRNMSDDAPMMIWVAGTDKLCTYFNRGWLEFRGRTMEQEVGMQWLEGVHPDDREQCLEVYNSHFAGRKRFEMEYRLQRFDGEYRWTVDQGRPRFTQAGEFLGYIGTAMDITERKMAESDLKRAHAELNKLKDQLEAENIYLQEELRQDQAFGDIVGESAAIKDVLRLISQVAPTDSTVLIAGETGTGKELLARAIHKASLRGDRPLIRVNCAALSPSLIESELFGHEKGAFTGAGARRIGRFELAHTGTLFLDEIGELPLDLQGKLLRVLQEREIERVGGGRTIQVDVRIIAATNRDLKQAVRNGTFREDLWYRLNIFPIHSPPLRDRRDDIPILAEHFAAIFAHRFGKKLTAISDEAMSAFCSYSWPGNVRELANLIEREVINLRGTVLRVHEDLEARKADAAATSFETLEGLERVHILKVLEELDWKVEGPKGAASVLDLNPSTLRSRMRKLGINKPNDRLPAA